MAGPPLQSINFTGKRYMSDLVFCICNVLSLGSLYIVCRLFPRAEIFLKTSNCELSDADCVVMEDQYSNARMFRVTRLRVTPTLGLNRYIKNQCCSIVDTPYSRFIYDYKLGRFVSPAYLLASRSFNDLFRNALVKSQGEEAVEIYEKRIVYGSNDLRHNLLSGFQVVQSRVFEAIFLWEAFSMVVWISIEYYRYAAVVGCIYLFVFVKKVICDIRYQHELAEMNRVGAMRVLRNGAFTETPETEVFPGDIVYVDVTDNFKCDVEILRGDVISDESFLTGEAVPIYKGPRSVVYSGTRVLKSTSTTIAGDSTRLQKLVKVKNLLRKPSYEAACDPSGRQSIEDIAIGIVIKTGKKTKKGTMLKNILIRRPVHNAFINQSCVVMKWLFAGSVFSMAVLAVYLFRYLPADRNFRFTIDLAIAFFSPALYSSLEMGVQHAREELLRKKINTMDCERINTAGEVDMVVFDKTGTLTEVGVDILCIDTLDRTVDSFERLAELEKIAVSTCHYVMELDGQYSGDVLDMKMFLFSGSTVVNSDGRRYVGLSSNSRYEPICREEPSETNSDCMMFFSSQDAAHGRGRLVEVLKIHDFDSFLKRMSVVVRTDAGRTYVFCKGAPDSLGRIIADLPPGYHDKVNDYGLQGYRIITLAWKEVAGCAGRDADESGLRFCGFVVFANRLKEETGRVIGELREARIGTKMCTGDNILTAISVARECGMIDREMPVLFPVVEDGDQACSDAEWYCVADEDYIFDKVKMSLYSEFDRGSAVDFAVACEGKEYECLKSTGYHRFILERGVIFARFNPENKKCLIEDYSDSLFTTMYCGDGANDTGALSAADVGLSLATNEASLAASFNSQELGAVLDLVKEGRSALAMSAAQFKYLFYAQVLTGLQMVSLLLFLYFPADVMSLVNDLMSVYVLGSGLYNFKAARKLHPRKLDIDLRMDSLLIGIELFLVFAIFFVTNYLLGFSERHDAVTIESRNAMATFVAMMFLLILKAFFLADFGPHRQPRSKNHRFSIIVGVCTALCGAITILLALGMAPVVSAFQSVLLTGRDLVVMASCLLGCLLASTVFHLCVARTKYSKVP